jgi:hypothetical protein
MAVGLSDGPSLPYLRGNETLVSPRLGAHAGALEAWWGLYGFDTCSSAPPYG